MNAKLKSPVKKKTLAKEVFELKELKRKINDSAEAVESLVKSVKDKSRQALAEALICGTALLRAKEIIKFGGFEKWCSENCKGIERKTVQKYMSLANRGSHLLETGVGLRQAYIAIGILKEDDSASGATSAMNGSSVHDMSLAGSIRASNGVSNGSTTHSTTASKTPLANTLAVGNGNKPIVTTKPTISKDDALSRARHLVNELVIDINNKLSLGLVTPADVSKELQPLASWLGNQKQTKGKR